MMKDSTILDRLEAWTRERVVRTDQGEPAVELAGIDGWIAEERARAGGGAPVKGKAQRLAEAIAVAANPAHLGRAGRP